MPGRQHPRARRPFRLAVLGGAALICTIVAHGQFRNASVAGQTAPAPFASVVEQLSEPNGEFDTDNLISNEQSYLHVVPALEQAGLSGGVYIRVGPDQNFSYIARRRPSEAFIVGIRPYSLLLHLPFEA